MINLNYSCIYNKYTNKNSKNRPLNIEIIFQYCDSGNLLFGGIKIKKNKKKCSMIYKRAKHTRIETGAQLPERNGRNESSI